MYVQTDGDERLPIAMGINVKIMAGIELKSLADRYQAHHDAFAAAHNISLSTSPWQITTEVADFSEPTGPASDVPEPRFGNGFSGYRYVMLRHEVALITSGTYVIHQDGKPIIITLDAQGPCA